jgi:tetratricopeptide (TPR) repeat protein
MNRIFLRDLELMDIEKEKIERKLAIVTQYITRAPKLAELYLIRGNIHLDAGRYNAAIPDFQEAGRCGAQLEAGVGMRRALYMREQATTDYL